MTGHLRTGQSRVDQLRTGRPSAAPAELALCATDKIRVVVADDDERVRDDFRALLELESDMLVVGVAADGASTVRLAERGTPDVVVMDVRMPVMDGIEATRILRRHHDEFCRVLVVTTFDLDEYVLGAARAGASGFLLKQQAPEQLAAAVRTIKRGDAIVSPRATARVLRELADPGVGPPADTRPLTEREVEVVRLLARGLSNDEIAAAASISRATVKSHVSNILVKLDLASRLQIVVWAYERRIADSS
ncbi:MAG: response regulator transcription factor [Nocardioides sp.]